MAQKTELAGTDSLPLGTPSAEQARLRDIDELELLSAPEAIDFDDLLLLVLQICDVEMAAVSIVGKGIVWLTRVKGSAPCAIPREDSICTETIAQDNVLVVQDVALERPDLLRRAPIPFRFYAGAPFGIRQGVRLGALCALSTSPKVLKDSQQAALFALARQVGTTLSLKYEKIRTARAHQKFAREAELRSLYFDNVPTPSYLKGAKGEILAYNEALSKCFGIGPSDWIGKTSHDLWPKDVADQISADEQAVLRTKQQSETYSAVPGSNGTKIWRLTKRACQDRDGVPVLACFGVDLSKELLARTYEQLFRLPAADLVRFANEQPQIDAVTGLLDERGFALLTASAVYALNVTGRIFSVLSLRVEQHHSHDLDDMLRGVARSICEVLPTSCALCYAGFGTYQMLLDAEQAELADEIVMRLRLTLEQLTLATWVFRLAHTTFNNPQTTFAEAMSTIEEDLAVTTPMTRLLPDPRYEQWLAITRECNFTDGNSNSRARNTLVDAHQPALAI